MRLFLYFLSGLLFGLYNEIYFEPMWDYSDKLKPFIYKDIPLISIPGWGLFSMFILWMSCFIQRKFEINYKNKIFVHIFLFVLIMAPIEYLMAKFNFWVYNYTLHENILTMMMGYAFVGLIISSLSEMLIELYCLYKLEK